MWKGGDQNILLNTTNQLAMLQKSGSGKISVPSVFFFFNLNILKIRIVYI